MNNNPNPNPVEPSGDLTEKELTFGYWYVKHKLLFKKILIGLFIAFDVVLIAYSIYGFVNHFFIEGPRLKQSISEMTENIIDTKTFRLKTRPENIRVLDTKVVSGGERKYDLVARVSNPNSEWLIYFDYLFFYAGGRTETKSTFVLPFEDKFIADFGIESEAKIISVNLNVENVRWQKVDRHEIPDFNQFYNEHFNFEVENTTFIPAGTAGLDVSRVTFDITNNSAYNFWQVGNYVILYQGTRIVGINYIVLNKFLSGQTRSVEARWFEKLPRTVKIEVRPEVNILDPEVYMAPGGDSGEIK